MERADPQPWRRSRPTRTQRPAVPRAPSRARAPGTRAQVQHTLDQLLQSPVCSCCLQTARARRYTRGTQAAEAEHQVAQGGRRPQLRSAPEVTASRVAGCPGGHVLLTPSTQADTRRNGNRGAFEKGFLRPRPGPRLQALVRNHVWTTGLSLAPSCSKVSQRHCFYGGWDTACLPPSASGFQDTQHRPSTGVSASYRGPSGAGRGAGGVS